jgi:hypothetical protein
MHKNFRVLFFLYLIFIGVCLLLALMSSRGGRQDMGVWVVATAAAGFPWTIGIFFATAKWQMGDTVFALLSCVCAAANVLILFRLSVSPESKLSVLPTKVEP